MAMKAMMLLPEKMSLFVKWKKIPFCILHAPTDEAVKNFPEDIDPATDERR